MGGFEVSFALDAKHSLKKCSLAETVTLATEAALSIVSTVSSNREPGHALYSIVTSN